MVLEVRALQMRVYMQLYLDGLYARPEILKSQSIQQLTKRKASHGALSTSQQNVTLEDSSNTSTQQQVHARTQSFECL